LDNTTNVFEAPCEAKHHQAFWVPLAGRAEEKKVLLGFPTSLSRHELRRKTYVA